MYILSTLNSNRHECRCYILDFFLISNYRSQLTSGISLEGDSQTSLIICRKDDIATYVNTKALTHVNKTFIKQHYSAESFYLSRHIRNFGDRLSQKKTCLIKAIETEHKKEEIRRKYFVH